MLTVSEKIRIILKRRGLKINDLARILETSQENISAKLKRDNFSEKDLKAFCAALNCSYDVLITLNDTKEKI